jgi:hypothetical protein
MTIIDSYDISAADEPELLKTLALLARRRPWHSRVAKAREWQTAFTVSAATAVKRPRDIAGQTWTSSLGAARPLPPSADIGPGG